MDAGANASVLPAFSVASLVGFGAVVAALAGLRGGARLRAVDRRADRSSRLLVATNLLAALTGSASGGLTIALEALGGTYMRLAAEQSIDPALMHRVAVIGAGTLDSLPHNGAVVTLLAVCGVDASRKLFRHVHGGDRRRDPCARRRDRIGHQFSARSRSHRLDRWPASGAAPDCPRSSKSGKLSRVRRMALWRTLKWR